MKNNKSPFRRSTAVGFLPKLLKFRVGAGDALIGTDFTYNPDAVLPLFKTAREVLTRIEFSSTRR